MLQTRIKQVEYLAAKLDEYGIPYQRPVGGHAPFIDADKVLDRIPKRGVPRTASHHGALISKPAYVAARSVTFCRP